MSELMKSVFCMEEAPVKHTPKNCKYVKLDYTRNGTIVLTGTNNPDEKIEVDELEKYMKCV